MNFSIVMPMFNSEKNLARSIDSILSQTFNKWELILVDDGSTDNSYAIAKAYAKNDSRIKVVRQENSGSGIARNKGINLAQGDYLVFCDADDYYNPHALQSFFESVKQNSPDLIISNYNEFYYTDFNKTIMKERRQIINQNIINKYDAQRKYYDFCKEGLINAPWGKAYKMRIVKEKNVRFEDIRRCQDVVFNLRFFNYVESISVINQKTYNYQTPLGDIYLSKFPVDMYKIVIDVYLLRMRYLEEWGEDNPESITFFNTALLKDLMICLRLNYKNKWNLSKEDQNLLYRNIICNPTTRLIINKKVNGLYANISKIALKTKNYLLIINYIRVINWFKKCLC